MAQVGGSGQWATHFVIHVLSRRVLYRHQIAHGFLSMHRLSVVESIMLLQVLVQI